jgi:hypothetical protein
MRTGVLLVAVLLLNVAHAEDFAWDQKAQKEIARREKLADRVDKIEEHWFHVTTAHYEVYSQVDARFTAELSLFMDLLRERFDAILKGTSQTDRKAEVFVYDSEAKYKDRLKSSGRGLYKYNFDGGGKFTEHALYSYIAKDEEKTFTKFWTPILLHEGTHQILRERVGTTRIPKWFNEGLANYFMLWDLTKTPAQNLEARPKRVVNPEFFKTSFESNTFLGLDELLALDDNTWASDDFGPVTKGQYASAETLLVTLMADGGTRKIVAKMYEGVLAGTDPAEALDAKTKRKLKASWREIGKSLGGVR